jgi:hypothetical protein
MQRNVHATSKENAVSVRWNWRGIVALSVFLFSFGLLILFAAPGSTAARDVGLLAAVRVQPQQVELEDGSTARFLANINVLGNGAGRGHLQLHPVEGDVQWARYQVEQARVICGDEGPAGVWLSGTVQQREANGRSTPNDIGPPIEPMTITVTQDTEIEECLIFDLSGPVVTEQTDRVEAEGRLRFTSNVCANGRRR